MDENHYVKVNGRWAYLYRDRRQPGRTVDFISLRRGNQNCIPVSGCVLNNVKKWRIRDSSARIKPPGPQRACYAQTRRPVPV